VGSVILIKNAVTDITGNRFVQMYGAT